MNSYTHFAIKHCMIIFQNIKHASPTLKHEIYSRMIEPFSIFQHLHPFKTHTKNQSITIFSSECPSKKIPTNLEGNSTEQAWRGPIGWRRGGGSRKEFGMGGEASSLAGKLFGFLEHVCKKSGWEQFHGCFFFLQFVGFPEWAWIWYNGSVVFLFLISYFSLESGYFFLRWECSWFWNWRVGSSKVSKTLEAKAFCLQSYFIIERERKSFPRLFCQETLLRTFLLEDRTVESVSNQKLGFRQRQNLSRFVRRTYDVFCIWSKSVIINFSIQNFNLFDCQEKILII